jgi:hypothetical protein
VIDDADDKRARWDRLKAEEAEFEFCLPLIRHHARVELGCDCDWCLWRKYNTLRGDEDPGFSPVANDNCKAVQS